MKTATRWVTAGLLLAALSLPKPGIATAQDSSWIDELKANMERELAPGAEIRGQNLWLAQEHSKGVTACKARTAPDVEAGVQMIQNCGACPYSKKQENIAKLKLFQDQKCDAEGLAAENEYVSRLESNFLKILADKNLNDRPWRNFPLDAPITSSEGRRSAYLYSLLLGQFHVEEAARYAADANTYCNVFVIDVTHNMNADLRNVLEDPVNGTSVNDIAKALKKNGKANGWYRVDWRVAQQMADNGKPAVALWENPDPQHHGHIAMVRPGSVGDSRGVALAQAGAFTVNASHLQELFVSGENALVPVEYWYHE